MNTEKISHAEKNSSKSEKKYRKRKLLLIVVLFVAVFFSVWWMKSSKKQEPKRAVYTPSGTYDTIPYPSADAQSIQNAQDTKKKQQEELQKSAYQPEEAEKKGLYVFDSQKNCYLTFNGGPDSATTPVILNLLKEHNIKATFFVTGEAAEQHPLLIKQMYNEGHVIANLSHSGNYEKLYEDTESFLDEINKCNKAIDTALGFSYQNRLFRFPGGTANRDLADFKNALLKNGMFYVDYDSNCGDAGINAPDAAYCYNVVLSSTKNGTKEDTVLMLTDPKTNFVTKSGLEQILNYLQKKGYTFCAIENKVN